MNVSKSEKAFRTITEVAEVLELPAHVLRFWESKFKYIKPMKRGGGRRYYRPEDINLLLGIKHLLHSDGLTIKGAQKLIQTKGVKSTAKLGFRKTLGESAGKPQVNLQKSEHNSEGRPNILGVTTSKRSNNIYNEKLKIVLSNLEEIRDRIKIRSTNNLVA